MSSFYIQKENLGEIPAQVLSVFQKKGFVHATPISIHGYRVLSFPKMKDRTLLHLTLGQTHLLVSGTCIYPKKNLNDSAKEVLNQFVSQGKVSAESLSGNFVLVFITPGGVQFQTDWSNGFSLYYNASLGIWSDSQLAVVVGIHAGGSPSSWNKRALQEIFATGSLMGRETTFNGVSRFDTQDQNAGEWEFLGLDQNLDFRRNGSKSMDEMINLQVKTLDNYFSDVQIAINEKGVSCGLTGGMDSRLLLLSIHRFAGHVPLSTFTNSRSSQSTQVHIAKELIRRLKIKWNMPKVKLRAKDPVSNLYFNDGILRMYHIWIEELKSRDFCETIGGENKLSMSGVGGEQYRNSEYLYPSQNDFHTWFKLEIVRKYSGRIFLSKREEEAFISSMKAKVYSKLGVDEHSSWSVFLIKRYFNEIFNPANRLVRNSIENQIGFFLSPFTDYRVAKRAYDCVPYLGNSLEFERQMILRVAQELSDVPLDYGFSPKDKTPLRYRMIATVKKNIPNWLLEYIYCRQKGQRFQQEWMKFPQSEEALKCVKQMNLNIDVNYIMSSELLAPLVIQLGMLDMELRPYLEKI
jgi:hypothetical protein